jgi:hypothetical protein
MNVQRGDVVLVDYPYAAGSGTKVRPVLVIQNDRDNQRLLHTIVAQITSVTRRALNQRRGRDAVVARRSLTPDAFDVFTCQSNALVVELQRPLERSPSHNMWT